MKHKPSMHKNKYYESNIGAYRVALGLSVEELGELSMMKKGAIARLQNGTEHPLYQEPYKGNPIGSWKQGAIDITNALNVIAQRNYRLKNPHGKNLPKITIGKVFPKHAKKARSELTISPEKLKSLYKSDYDRATKSPEELCEEKDYRPKIKNAMKTILHGRVKGRDKTDDMVWDILERRLFSEETLSSIGKEYQMGREGIRQIQEKALKILRHPVSKRKLIELLED